MRFNLQSTMYKAAFIDMDGTLLRKDHTVSDITRQIIQELIEKGIIIAPVSARPLHGIQHVIGDFIASHIPVVSLNGSYIFHNDEIIYEVNIDTESAKKVHHLLSQYPVSSMYYSKMDWYAEADTAATRKEQKITDIPITIQPFGQTLAIWEQTAHGPNKILIAGDEQVILNVETVLLENFGSYLNVFKSQSRYVEVMHKNASKTHAIQLLMNHYGLKQEEIIAVGDNYNDKGMIEFAGIGVAMGNAPDEIKAAANYVTDTNDNDGVAKALLHFFR